MFRYHLLLPGPRGAQRDKSHHDEEEKHRAHDAADKITAETRKMKERKNVQKRKDNEDKPDGSDTEQCLCRRTVVLRVLGAVDIMM